MIQMNSEKCIGCGLCAKDCVASDLVIENGNASAKNISCIKCGHCIAVCPTNAISIDDYNMADVIDYDKETFDIEPERILNFIKFRRSIRHFKENPVETDKISKIIEAGRFTATGSNSQNVSYVVVRDHITELRSLALRSLNDTAQLALSQQQPNPASVYYAKKFKSMYEADLAQPGKEDSLFFHAPAVLLIVSDSPVNAALAASNMELMAVAQGLGAFYCGFFTRAAHDNQEIKKLLGLSAKQEIAVCLVLGYPDVTYLRTVPRKKADVSWS